MKKIGEAKLATGLADVGNDSSRTKNLIKLNKIGLK